MEYPDPINEQKETVKLIKNTKGYNWEIKLNKDILDGATLERLELINKMLEGNYGSK